MMRIWGRANSMNVQKVIWIAEELALPYERKDVGGPFGGLDAPSYGEKNPNRKIPALEVDGKCIWESNAIVRYIAAKHDPGGLSPTDPWRRAEADQWMDWAISTIFPDLVTVFIGLVRTPPEKRDTAAIDAAAAKLGASFALLDTHLAGRAHVAGEQFTMGDIPVGVMAQRFLALDITRAPLPHLQHWFARLAERPPFREHVMTPLS